MDTIDSKYEVMPQKRESAEVRHQELTFQLSVSDWMQIKHRYEKWCDVQWRNLVEGFRGGNQLPLNDAFRIIKLLYCGCGLQEIIRRVPGHGKMTVSKVKKKLMAFLKSEEGRFPNPICACGGMIWHKNPCLFWQPNFHKNAARGRATQKRLALENRATIFFKTMSETQQLNQIATNELTAKRQKKVTREQISAFASSVQAGIDAWVKAGEILVEMIEIDPEIKSRIIEDYPSLSPEIISRFEAIGRRQIHPKTLLDNGPGMKRLRRLPYSDQVKYLDEPVPLLISREDHIEELQVSIKNLTTGQAAQVMSPNGVRDLGAQRAWIEGRKKKKCSTQSKGYVIQNGRVIFKRGAEMTAHDLAQLLAEVS